MPRFFQITRVLAVVAVLQVTSCDAPVQKQAQREADPVSEQFVKANQYMLRRHQDQIAAFVERVGWDATVTPSGLWVVLEDSGSGPKIGINQRVTYAYESMLLDGTPCYSATEQHPMVVTIGRGGVESGVEEGLQLMKEGGEATLIIPPHLAHGNFGDRDKIPGNTVIIYHVKVLEVR